MSSIKLIQNDTLHDFSHFATLDIDIIPKMSKTENSSSVSIDKQFPRNFGTQQIDFLDPDVEDLLRGKISPCPKPEGKKVVETGGATYDLQVDSGARITTVVKQSADGRVTGRHMIVSIEDPEGDQVWILPQNPSLLNKSRRIQLSHDNHLELTAFEGESEIIKGKYHYETGELLPPEAVETPEATPLVRTLPKSETHGLVITMATLVHGEPITLSEAHSFATSFRSNKITNY